MAAWGVSLVDGKIAGDLDAAIRVNSNAGGGQPVVSDYVVWLQLGPENFDRQELPLSAMPSRSSWVQPDSR